MDASLTNAAPDSAETLREKEAFNFALFQHNPLAITVVDSAGRAIKSNLARRAAPDPLPPLGAPLFAHVKTEGMDLQAELLAAIRDGRSRDFAEVKLDERIYALTIAPFPQGAIVIRRDITEQKQALAQLVQAQKLAALGTLATGIAHEISNPNNVIMLGANTLRKHIEALLPILDAYREAEGDFEVGARTYDAIRGECLDLTASCQRGAERIHQLLTDLKRYARLDSGALEAVDVNAVVQGAVGLMGATIRKATRRFEVHCADALPPVRAVARRLEQVVINLLGNACQALPDPDRAIELSTAHDPAAGRVLIRVRDEGRGIAPEAIPRLTDPFFTTRHDDGGTGLGLSISHQIIESFQGAITFESQPGHGATVTVALPEGA